METRDRKSNQGGQGQGNKSGKGRGQRGNENPEQGGREGESGSDKPSTRPTPSGVPNEGRGSENQHGAQDQGVRTGKGDYEYKGGRQGTGGIPNPDDRDDSDSAGSFRGTAEPESDENDEDDEQSIGPGQGREENLDSQPRNPR